MATFAANTQVTIWDMIDKIETAHPNLWVYYVEEKDAFFIYGSFQELREKMPDFEFEAPNKGMTHQEYADDLTDQLNDVASMALGKAFDKIIEDQVQKVGFK